MMFPMRYVPAPETPTVEDWKDRAGRIEAMRQSEPDCPSCGRSLIFNEHLLGATYVCHGADCMEIFDAEEIEG